MSTVIGEPGEDRAGSNALAHIPLSVVRERPNKAWGVERHAALRVLRRGAKLVAFVRVYSLCVNQTLKMLTSARRRGCRMGSFANSA